MSRPPSTLLLGYSGKGNFGDDVMIDAVTRALPDMDYIVLSGQTPIRTLMPLLRAARRIVVCGGHVISPRTGSYQRVLMLARLMGVKRVFFSIEVSGWPGGRAGKLQRWLMGGARISVRTPESRAILTHHLPAENVVEVLDAFYLHPDLGDWDGARQPLTLDRFHFDPTRSGRAETVLLPRSFSSQGPYAQAQNIARFLECLGPPGPYPLRMSPSAVVDDVTEMAQALKAAGHAPEILPADALLSLHRGSRVITNRLHIGKAACYFGIPFTLVSYDSKTEAPAMVGRGGQILQLDGTQMGLDVLIEDKSLFAMRRDLSLAVLNRDLTA